MNTTITGRFHLRFTAMHRDIAILIAACLVALWLFSSLADYSALTTKIASAAIHTISGIAAMGLLSIVPGDQQYRNIVIVLAPLLMAAIMATNPYGLIDPQMLYHMVPLAATGALIGATCGNMLARLMR